MSAAECLAARHTIWLLEAGCVLLAAALALALAAASVGGERLTMPGLYDKVKGRWPYVLGVASTLVTAAYADGYLTDKQFAVLAALGGSGAVPALRAALKHVLEKVVADAIARKVQVQVTDVRAAEVRRPAPAPEPDEVTPVRVPPVPPRPRPAPAAQSPPAAAPSVDDWQA